MVFADLNENGLQDTGEPGVQGAVVVVQNSAGVDVGIATTDAMGNYLLPNLVAGDYIVTFALPGTLEFTQQNVGDDDTIDSDADPATGATELISLLAGQDLTNVDAGVLAAQSELVGSISNLVFEDLNANGTQNTGEPGVPGIAVTVRDAANIVVGTAITDGDGLYLVDNLPSGSYTVEFTIPAVFAFTAQDQGFDDAFDSDPDPATGIAGPITVLAGLTNSGVDAGLVPAAQAPTATPTATDATPSPTPSATPTSASLETPTPTPTTDGTTVATATATPIPSATTVIVSSLEGSSLEYPGPFSSAPDSFDNANPFAPVDVVAGSGTGGSDSTGSDSGSGTLSRGLAQTGTNTPLLATASVLLLTLGGLLMVASRREQERDS